MDYVWFLFRFEGRINRAKYWLAGLIIICWMIFLGALVLGIGNLTGITSLKSFGFGVDDIFGIVDPASFRALASADPFRLCFKAIGVPLFVWVYLATSVKRLHDRDKSGWWMIPFFVIPGLLNQFADRLPDDSYAIMVLGLIAFVLCTWGFIEMCFLKGSRKTNRFGANPLLRSDTRPRWEQQSEIEMVPHKAGPPPVWRVKRGT
jgi:uncharacterized membrane protein YhaH (DUF805 family)